MGEWQETEWGVGGLRQMENILNSHHNKKTCLMDSVGGAGEIGRARECLWPFSAVRQRNC